MKREIIFRENEMLNVWKKLRVRILSI